jgi:predicted component of type VI protein secretion system
MLLAPDFGVDDVTFLFHSFPGGLDPWISRFEETVGKYEPRLRDVRVVRVASGSLELMLRIEIHATLVAASRNSPATFAATIDPHSRLTVR